MKRLRAAVPGLLWRQLLVGEDGNNAEAPLAAPRTIFLHGAVRRR